MKLQKGDRVILRENGCDCVVCTTVKEKNIVGTITKGDIYCDVNWDNGMKSVSHDYKSLQKVEYEQNLFPDEFWEI